MLSTKQPTFDVLLFSHDYVFTLDPFKSQLHLVHLARAHFVHATHIPSSFFKHAHSIITWGARLWQTTFILLISSTPSELPLGFLLIRWNMRAFYQFVNASCLMRTLRVLTKSNNASQISLISLIANVFYYVVQSNQS